MKVALPTRMTIADLERFPDDGNRYELIDGELFVSAAPLKPHQRALKRLFRKLDEFVEENDLGEVYFAPFDVDLTLPGASGDTRVEPDLFFVSKARVNIIQERVQGAPDLVVEILSESTSRVDLYDKRDAYRAAAVKEYWVVNPGDQTVAVYRFATGEPRLVLFPKDTLTTPMLPGFQLSVAYIFG